MAYCSASQRGTYRLWTLLFLRWWSLCSDGEQAWGRLPVFALAVVCISASGMEAQAGPRRLPGHWLGTLPRHHQGIKMEAFWGLLHLFFYHMCNTNFWPLSDAKGVQLNLTCAIVMSQILFLYCDITIFHFIHSGLYTVGQLNKLQYSREPNISLAPISNVSSLEIGIKLYIFLT